MAAFALRFPHIPVKNLPDLRIVYVGVNQTETERIKLISFGIPSPLSIIRGFPQDRSEKVSLVPNFIPVSSLARQLLSYVSEDVRIVCFPKGSPGDFFGNPFFF